jgi:hypothetical protein
MGKAEFSKEKGLFGSKLDLNLRKKLVKGGGHAVAQLFEALRYKPEGRGFDSRWCHRNFPLT